MQEIVQVSYVPCTQFALLVTSYINMVHFLHLIPNN